MSAVGAALGPCYGVALTRRVFLGIPLAIALLLAPAAHASEAYTPEVFPGDEGDPARVSSHRSEAEPVFTGRRFVLQGRFGRATSVGLLGVVAELNVHDRLAIYAGGGTNLMGWSPAFGMRLRPIIWGSGGGVLGDGAFAVTLEGSVSRAPFDGPLTVPVYCVDNCPIPPGRSSLLTRTVSWGQLELGGEVRAATHYQGLFSLGWARMLGAPRFNCERDLTKEIFDCSDDARVTRNLLVATVAIGYAF